MLRYLNKPFQLILPVAFLCIFAVVDLTPAVKASSDVRIGEVSKRAFLGAKGTRVDGSSRSLYHRTAVHSNETVTTGRRVETTLRLLDQSKLQIGPTSRIVLDNFVYDTSADTGQMAATFAKGAFRFITGDMKNKEGFRFETPVAFIGIRGTDFITAVADDGSTRVDVLEGEIEIEPKDGSASVSVPAGQSASVGTTGGVTLTSESLQGLPGMASNPY